MRSCLAAEEVGGRFDQPVQTGWRRVGKVGFRGKKMTDQTTVRKMRADARENRERILEATRELLVEHGPDVPLDQIAARAGTSIATFYRRFEDRTALLTALVSEESAVLLAAVEDLSDYLEGRPGREKWETAIQDLMLSSRSRMAPVMAAFNSGALPVTEELLSMHTKVKDLFAGIISTAQDQGLVRYDTTHQEVMTLLVTAMQPNLHLTPDQNRELAARMIGVVLAGLSPDAASVPLSGSPLDLEFNPTPRDESCS